MLPPLPGWIVSAPSEPPEAAAFRSGAALAHLSLATATEDLPMALWRDRLALAAQHVVPCAVDGAEAALADLVLDLELGQPGADGQGRAVGIVCGRHGVCLQARGQVVVRGWWHGRLGGGTQA